MIKRMKAWTRAANRDLLAMYWAVRDPRVPWWIKVGAAVVVGYALSPIDLIPDFIPVIGYLDDLVLVTLLVLLLVRMIPKAVMDDLRRKATSQLSQNSLESRIAAGIVVAVWIFLAVGLTLLAVKKFRGE